MLAVIVIVIVIEYVCVCVCACVFGGSEDPRRARAQTTALRTDAPSSPKITANDTNRAASPPPPRGLERVMSAPRLTPQAKTATNVSTSSVPSAFLPKMTTAAATWCVVVWLFLSLKPQQRCCLFTAHGHVALANVAASQRRPLSLMLPPHKTSIYATVVSARR